jgi:hypothetical protein
MSKKYTLSKNNIIYDVLEIIDDMVYVKDRGLKGFLYDYEIKAYSDWKFILYYYKLFHK